MNSKATETATQTARMQYQEWQAPADFWTEEGTRIARPVIGYHTAGRMNARGDNVVWVAHALTANSDVADWWPQMVGPGRLLDTERYFVVSANVLGSCYGTTGPASVSAETGRRYYGDFPFITIRDMVRLHQHLRRYLGIAGLKMLIGGSIGGYQALEWAIMEPELTERLVLLATSAQSSPWTVAFNESQRMALQADASFGERRPEAGRAGLRAARSIALLSYRNSATYNATQAETNGELTRDFRASSYQRYQGDKLVKRFDAYAYKVLLDAMDSHDVGRGRGPVQVALARIRARTLVIGVQSDYLFPAEEQRRLAEEIPGAALELLKSGYGHDGFLVETGKITRMVREWMEKAED